MTYGRLWAIVVAVTLLGGGTVQGQSSAPGKESGPKAPVRLVSSVSAIAPGMTLDVGLAYKLADEWHIYWKNPGDSGGCPKVKWNLPAGFRVGELQFPAPRRYESGPADFRLITYVLDGEPVLLASVTAPHDLKPGDSVTLAAKVNSVVCHTECRFEEQDVSVTLPVVADASQVESANKELFDDAWRQLPAADGTGKFIRVSAKPSAQSIAVGGSLDLDVAIKIKPDHKIQSNKPYIAGFIPTEVILEPTPGVELGQFVYPKAKERMDKILKQKMSEFDGEPVIRVPITKINDDARGDSLTLSGIVIAQACSKKGTCYPPEAVEWSTTVALTGAKAAAAPLPDDSTVVASIEDSEPAPADDGATATVQTPVSAEPGGEAGGLSLPMMLLFAFLGGVILNVMPCVWPVISIKVLSFVQQAHDDPKRVLRLGMLFGLGILVSFWILGIVAVTSKAAAGATWGTQFSNPTFVVAMIVILFVFGMSLFGVFEINLPGAAAGTLSAASAREGYGGSFVKGMLATVLATPCTAPLLGPAIAFAFQQSGSVIMAAMTAIGLGMALPYVILAAKPNWLHFLPKPGPWMDNFKQFTGFLLIGVVVWLLWVLGSLTGESGVVAAIAFLAFLGMACWMYGRIKMTWSTAGRLMGTAAAVAIAVIGGWFASNYMYTPPADDIVTVADDGAPMQTPMLADWTNKTPWRPHRPGLGKQLAAEGKTVFLNYTAVWCTKCLIEKKTIIETDDIRKKMSELGVVPLTADYTRKPDWLTEEIKSYGRAGVPLDVIIPACKPDEPIIVPELFTAGTLEQLLDQAGPSTACEAATRVASAQGSM